MKKIETENKTEKKSEAAGKTGQKSTVAEKKKKSVKKEKSGPVSRAVNRILLKIIIILVLICGLCFGGYFGFQKLSEIRTEKKSMLALTQLEQCGELVSIKNSYSDVVTIKKTRIAGLAKSFSIVRYTGILRAGIRDISLAEIKVSNAGKSVEVILPECEVLGNDISDIEVFDEARSIFVAVSMKEIVEEINLSRGSTEIKLIEAGILDEAKAQAVLVVKNVLKAAGFAEVSVK